MSTRTKKTITISLLPENPNGGRLPDEIEAIEEGAGANRARRVHSV
jgi:hypothetical protein